ncbi:MAG: NAD-dependent protein deacetylase [Aquiluna sp.]|nr:NAD-dependent protein deacetylase [Aquiluna sp.]
MQTPLDPVVEYGIDRARELLGGKKVLAITGAGVSTESGIPDYRGQGRVVKHPLTFDEFLASASNQARYWARSFAGWNRIATAEPNTAHRALAAAEHSGQLSDLITQNVDGLHQKAGSENVLELHGRLDRVVCIDCSSDISRLEMDSKIQLRNPGLVRQLEVEFTPDGDAEIEIPADFATPACQDCGGRYKPDVVFFGEQIPLERVNLARAQVQAAEAVLVAGSSLSVNSGLRLVKQAKQQGLPVVIVNLGETKADQITDVKINASASVVLGSLYL